MSAGIYVAIDGQPVDLSEVSWYEKAPCGCVCGVHMAWLANSDICITTADQAADESSASKRERDKYAALGFAWFPERTSRVKELLENDCPHDPKWGKPARPQLEGHTWAAVSALGSRSSLMHLVPDVGVENADERRYGSGHTAALCGSKAFWWRTDWYVLDGKVECSRCEKKAAAS